MSKGNTLGTSAGRLAGCAALVAGLSCWMAGGALADPPAVKAEPSPAVQPAARTTRSNAPRTTGGILKPNNDARYVPPKSQRPNSTPRVRRPTVAVPK